MHRGTGYGATKGFLVDLTTRERITFLRNPSEIEETKTPEWANLTTPGASHPRLHFVNGGERTFQFQLNFFTDVATKEEIKKQVDWLRSLAYPTLDGNQQVVQGAPVCLFTFGELYRNIRVVVVEFKFRSFYMFDPTSLLPLRADVDLVLKEHIDRNVSSAQIRGGL